MLTIPNQQSSADKEVLKQLGSVTIKKKINGLTRSKWLNRI